MAIRFYILPIIRVNGARYPKYFQIINGPDIIISGINCPWSAKDYGSIDMAILCADILDADHTILSGNADVYSFPLDLDIVMTLSDRQTANTYFEAHGIPGDWLAQGDTFRSVLRTVTCLFFYLQRVLALIDYPIDPFFGLTLNTQYRNIPNPLHDAMQQGAISLNYAWNVNNNDQIRKIFKQMADAWGVRSILFGLVVL